ncbi:hypothetical protein ACKI1Q_04845 [Streptomyces galilaeus]|uniref:hypothetical protein n=1 Tax=Streptomyces galilaeus TaxID=33899 RepID=UPI0038F60B32
MTRATLGAEDYAKLQQSIGAYNSGATVQQLLGMGVPTTTAVVVAISDTGRLVNFDPVVDLILQLTGAGATTDPITLQTIVSKLRIPRPGDQVLLIADPANPRRLPLRGRRSDAVTSPRRSKLRVAAPPALRLPGEAHGSRCVGSRGDVPAPAGPRPARMELHGSRDAIERIRQRAFEQAALSRTPPATTPRYAHTSACAKSTRASLRCHCWPPRPCRAAGT